MAGSFTAKSLRLMALMSFSLVSHQVLAATGTIVKILDENEVTTIITDGKQAKMNSATNEYTIVEFKSGIFKHVSPDENEVMIFDTSAVQGGKKPPQVKAKMKKLGDGPTIAGYDTEKYSYLVKDRTCGVVYGSDDAAGAEGIQELLNAMTKIAEKTRAMMGGFAGMVDDCEQAEINMINKVGVPMRVERDGKVLSEVKSIKTAVDIPKDTFVIPASYKRTTMKEKLAEAQKQMQQYQPQMQEMMKQMQQSGQMTPEMMERMKQAQEMMKQYQQQ